MTPPSVRVFYRCPSVGVAVGVGDDDVGGVCVDVAGVWTRVEDVGGVCVDVGAG